MTFEFDLKDGRLCKIRNAKVADAEMMLNYMDKVAGESDNLTFGSGELNLTIEDEVRFLEGIIDAGNKCSFLALMGDEIVSVLNFAGGHRPRISHVGEFGVSVLKDYWGNGIGRHMVECMLEWASRSGEVAKINLQVREDNDHAIRLYKSLGFVVEGMTTRSFKINGIYYKNYHMGIEVGD